MPVSKTRSSRTSLASKPNPKQQRHHTAPAPAPTADALFISRHQAAALAGLNLQLIDAAIRGGHLPASKIGKRRIVIERAEFVQWVRGQRV